MMNYGVMVYISNVFRILGLMFSSNLCSIKGKTSWYNLLQVRRGLGVGVKGVRLPARFDITLA